MIISGLVKKGYKVGPASADKVTVGDNTMISSLIALRVDAESEHSDKLHDVVSTILRENNIIYYSLIVSVACMDCLWNVSGISVPKALPPPPIPNIRKPDSGLN